MLQDYSAYTSALDRLEADRLASPHGPQRILRQAVPVGNPAYPQTSIDGRLLAWDPPAKYLAMLCHYLPLATNRTWEVLARVGERCGSPRRLGSVSTRFGAAITVPAPPPGNVVYARIQGAGVAGFERVRNLLFRADFRYVVVNGSHTYRLVPGTAGDGLILRAAPGVDYPSPFTLAPGARTVRLIGLTGALRVDFYAVAVARPGGSDGGGRSS